MASRKNKSRAPTSREYQQYNSLQTYIEEDGGRSSSAPQFAEPSELVAADVPSSAFAFDDVN
jgi:hypothetical protein